MSFRTVLASSRRPVEKSIYLILLAVWSIPPLAIILLLTFAPAVFLGSDKMGLTAAIWAVASVLLFTILLIHDHKSSTSSSTQTIQNLMGLTCTLALGIPAMAISSIPVMGSPADFLASFSSEGSEVALAPIEAHKKKTLYLIGIDASKSFLKNSADPRLPMIRRTIDSFFTGVTLQSFALSIHPQSVVRVFAFAEDVKDLEENLEGEPGTEERRRALIDSIQRRLTQYLDSVPDRQRNSTDLLKLLNEKVCPCLRNSDGFEEVKVIVFSDWIQSPSPETDAEESSGLELRYNDKMQLFESCLTERRTSFLAFSARPHDRSGDENKYVYQNIAAYLRSKLRESEWLELQLETYDEASQEEKTTLPTSLYSNVVSTPTLYLKYYPAPRWQALESSLVLPQSDQSKKFFLELKPLTSDVTPVYVQVLPSLTRSFSLGIGDRERTGLIRSENSPTKLSLSRDPQGERDARIELRIAVPEHSTLYKVPVVVLPVLNRDAVLVLAWIVLALHTFPLILSVKIFLTRFYPRTERLPQPHPAESPRALEVAAGSLETPPAGR